MSAESLAIGMYYDWKHKYYFVLTEKLKFLYYNRTTYTLERVCDFENACQLLCLDRVCENIYTQQNFMKKNEEYSSAECAYDYDTFEKM